MNRRIVDNLILADKNRGDLRSIFAWFIDSGTQIFQEQFADQIRDLQLDECEKWPSFKTMYENVNRRQAHYYQNSKYLKSIADAVRLIQHWYEIIWHGLIQHARQLKRNEEIIETYNRIYNTEKLTSKKFEAYFPVAPELYSPKADQTKNDALKHFLLKNNNNIVAEATRNMTKAIQFIGYILGKLSFLNGSNYDSVIQPELTRILTEKKTQFFSPLFKEIVTKSRDIDEWHIVGQFEAYASAINSEFFQIAESFYVIMLAYADVQRKLTRKLAPYELHDLVRTKLNESDKQTQFLATVPQIADKHAKGLETCYVVTRCLTVCVKRLEVVDCSRDKPKSFNSPSKESPSQSVAAQPIPLNADLHPEHGTGKIAPSDKQINQTPSAPLLSVIVSFKDLTAARETPSGEMIHLFYFKLPIFSCTLAPTVPVTQYPPNTKFSLFVIHSVEMRTGNRNSTSSSSMQLSNLWQLIFSMHKNKITVEVQYYLSVLEFEETAKKEILMELEKHMATAQNELRAIFKLLNFVSFQTLLEYFAEMEMLFKEYANWDEIIFKTVNKIQDVIMHFLSFNSRKHLRTQLI